jgi:hypothetical protein
MSMESGSRAYKEGVNGGARTDEKYYPRYSGCGDYSNEPPVISKEPSFGLKFGFL